MVNAMSPVLSRLGARRRHPRRGASTAPASAGCARAATSSRSITAPAPTASEARQFWYDEYLLNAQIGRFPKPYVALMDGIVMGGGVGVGAHGSVRVVTDTTKMAMPEVGIGFIPDVGGTLILSRAPGLLGLHAALTGAPFSGADAIAMGFADHFVPHDDPRRRSSEAIVADGIDAALAAHAVEPPPSPLWRNGDWIDECFAGDTVEDIVAALRGHDAGPGQRRRQPDRHAAPPSRCRWRWRRSAAPPNSTHWKTFCARSIGRRAASLRSARPRRGHPRPGHRQGPQPEVVAARRWRRSPPPTSRPTSRRPIAT